MENEIVLFDGNELSSVLSANSSSADKAITYGNELLERINREGMTDEVDALANSYLARIRETQEVMKGRRSPITSKFDEIRSKFTSLEAQIDVKSSSTTPGMIQTHRDNFAKKKAEEKRKEEAERIRKANVEKEKVSIKISVESQITLQFQKSLDFAVKTIRGMLNNVTLENYSQMEMDIMQSFPAYMHAEFESMRIDVRPIYLNQSELDLVMVNAKLGKFDAFSMQYKETIDREKKSVLEMIPGKLKVLQDIEKSKGEERARLLKEEEDRKQKAIADAENERIAREKAAQDELARKESIETTEALFAATAQSFEASPVGKKSGSVRKSTKIVVKESIGYMDIFAFYMTHTGRGMDVADLAKVTLKSMVTFCEKAYKDTGEMIQSASLSYEEEIKTVAR